MIRKARVLEASAIYTILPLEMTAELIAGRPQHLLEESVVEGPPGCNCTMAHLQSTFTRTLWRRWSLSLLVTSNWRTTNDSKICLMQPTLV